MSFVVIFLMIIAALFAMVFFTKRRFGVLGLALAAGAMLSTLWVGELTPIIARAGIVVVKPPLESLVAVGLTLLPVVLLLSSGPTYKSMSQRLIGAAAFAILAIAFLLQPLGSALVIDSVGQPVYHNMIVTVGLLLAVGDILFNKTPKYHDKH